MKGVIVRNRYYSDDGTEYVLSRLSSELKVLGIDTDITDAFSLLSLGDLPSFAVFWDKDTQSARLLERKGVRLFDTASAIRICDDKYLTAAELEGVADFPESYPTPLKYPVSDGRDEAFTETLISRLGFPLIAKYCVGSLGAQVFLIKDREELASFQRSHSDERVLYQRFVSESAGKDIRIYTVGGKTVACVARESADSFKSNAEQGATTRAFTPSRAHIETAERISRTLGLDYGAIDFFRTAEPLVAEVNSNAYFKDAEKASGVNIAACYARRIAKETACLKKM